jgi:hypothetical protein
MLANQAGGVKAAPASLPASSRSLRSNPHAQSDAVSAESTLLTTEHIA